MRSKKGFTLIEMMVVIAIIAVLVSVVIPIVGNSTLKARAATNAANLRSVQGSVQASYLLDRTLFNKSVSRASGEVVNFTNGLSQVSLLAEGNEAAFQAPNSEEVVVGNVDVSEGTPMVVRINTDGSAIATYDGYTAEDFAKIAETGKADGISPSLTDAIIADTNVVIDSANKLVNRIDAITDGAIKEIAEFFGLDADTLRQQFSDSLNEVIASAGVNSDCLTCSSNYQICDGYNGVNGGACSCTHDASAHASFVLEDISGMIDWATEQLDPYVCPDGKKHSYSEDHYCTNCAKFSGSSSHDYGLFNWRSTCSVCGKSKK